MVFRISLKSMQGVTLAEEPKPPVPLRTINDVVRLQAANMHNNGGFSGLLSGGLDPQKTELLCPALSKLLKNGFPKILNR